MNPIKNALLNKQSIAMRKILIFFFVFLSLSLYGRGYSSDIDSIHITFEYEYGYGTCRSTASYVFQDNIYKLVPNEASNAKNAPKLIGAISKKNVDKLLKDCNRHASADICKYISITSDDYADYAKILNDSIAFENEYVMIYYLLCDKRKREDYILNKETFLSLECDDILKIIDTHYHFYFNKFVTKIDLFTSDGDTISIAPKCYYEGTPWSVFSRGKELYLSNDDVMSFLKNTQLEHIAPFWEKSYLLIQIADYFLHQDNPNSCMIYQYWEKLSEKSQSDILKSLHVGDDVMKLYKHQIKMTDDDTSAALLEILCSPKNDDERMLYFFLMNEVMKQADGALSEMLGEYCLQFFNENADYVLHYFNTDRYIARLYSSFIGTELYYNNSSISEYSQQLSQSVNNKYASSFLPTFLKDVEHYYNSAEN